MAEKSIPPPNSPPPAYSLSEKTKSTFNEKSPQRSTLPRGPFQLDLPILNSLRTKRVVLASSSPRRRALLAQIGLTKLDIIPSDFAEDLPKTLTPFDYVLQTATAKALAVYPKCLDDPSKGDLALLLAADTIVVSSGGSILEKPRSEAHHVAMLRELRDTGKHTVLTAVVAMAPLESARDPGYALETAVEETSVKFDPELSDEMIMAYVRTREGVDKAGGYGIQGIGALLVEKVEGGYENVAGLPLRRTLKLIEKVNLKAQDELDDDDSDEDEDEV